MKGKTQPGEGRGKEERGRRKKGKNCRGGGGQLIQRAEVKLGSKIKGGEEGRERWK